MVTGWRELIPKIAKDIGESEEYVEEQLLLYTKTLHEGLKNFENVEFDLFYLGKLYMTQSKADKLVPGYIESEYTTDKQRENLSSNLDKLKIINKVGRQPGKPKKKRI